MAYNTYTAVSTCKSCTRNNTRFELKWSLELFPALGLLGFVVMDILGPLTRTIHENRHVIVLTDR